MPRRRGQGWGQRWVKRGVGGSEASPPLLSPPLSASPAAGAAFLCAPALRRGWARAHAPFPGALPGPEPWTPGAVQHGRQPDTGTKLLGLVVRPGRRANPPLFPPSAHASPPLAAANLTRLLISYTNELRTRETTAPSTADTAVRNGWAGLMLGWGGSWRHCSPSVLLVLPQPLSFPLIFPPSLPPHLPSSLSFIFPQWPPPFPHFSSVSL